MDVYIGFDSAWTDNKKNPGAICAIGVQKDRVVFWQEPKLASFDEALSFIREFDSTRGVVLIALDQPTRVPNLSSMRPVEKCVASLVSWLGGGVQAAHRGKKMMFCDDSPIWTFLTELDALERPTEALRAASGLYLMEVFPALELTLARRLVLRPVSCTEI